MNKTGAIVLGLIAIGTAQLSWADMHKESEHGGMHGKHGHMESKMSKMDTNKDGMLSKEEFLKAHEAMFDRLKGENGMISLNEMAEKHESMMGGRGRMDSHRHGGMDAPGK